MSSEMEEVMINTQLFGIYSPKNYHSFHNTWKILFLQTCQACGDRIYPLTPACSCLRCGCVAHRKCIQKLENCSYFTFEKPLSQSEVLLTKPAESSSSASNEMPIPRNKTAADVQFDSIFELKLEQIVEKACSIPDVLEYVPEIKSPFCIWRTLLRAIVIRQTTSLNRVAPICTDESTSAVESSIRSCLADLDGFAGQLFVVCFYVFLSLNVFTSMDMVVAHGRECIDTVADGLFCICAEESLQDPRIIRNMIVAVEKVIFNEQSGAFYEKIFQFVKKEAQSVTLNQVFQDAHSWSERRWREFDKYASAIQMKRCPKEKLMIFVVFLQLIAEATSSREVDESGVDVASKLYIVSNTDREDEESVIESDVEQRSGVTSGDKTGEDLTISAPSSSSAGERREEEDNDEDDRAHAVSADSDKPRTTMASNEDPQSNVQLYRREDINADKLIELLGCIIFRQQDTGVCDWVAEYLFLSSDIVADNSVDTAAAEGYALATLQQCMTVLLQPTSSTNVKATGG